MWINYFYTDDPFMFIHNAGYKGKIENPAINLYNGLTSSYFTLGFLAWFTLSFILAWIFFCKHLNLPLNIIILYSVFIPMSYGLMSMPRMMLAAFPFFILTASVSVKYKIQNALVIVLSIIQGYFFVCWCLGFGNVI